MVSELAIPTDLVGYISLPRDEKHLELALLGGVVAAPFAALLTRRVPARVLLILVGIIIVLLSIRGIWQALSTA